MCSHLEILSRIKARAYFRLASGQEAAHENEYPICVYNPHPYPVKATVTCEDISGDYMVIYATAYAVENGEVTAIAKSPLELTISENI